MTTLELGTKPGDLKVNVRRNRAWSASLVLKQVTGPPEAQVKTPIAWPAQPVLEFENGVTTTGTLSADSETSTPDAKATWTLTAEQATSLTQDMDASLLVSTEEWFFGRVVSR